MITPESAKLREMIRTGLVCRCSGYGTFNHEATCLWDSTMKQIYALEQAAEDKFMAVLNGPLC